MRHSMIRPTLLLLALLAPGAGGCASGLLHRGGPAVASVDAPREPRTKTEHRERGRHGRTDGSTSAAVPVDPLAEARLRAQENPGEPWWPYRVGRLEAAAGHAAEAEASLRAALERDSSYAPALTALSRLLYQQDRHEEAVRLLDPVRDRRIPLGAAERSAVLSGLALHEAALGRDDQAHSALALLSGGERDDAAGVAAFLAVRGRSADSALKLTERAVRAAPESAANHNNRGIALLRSADPDGAALEFERAIALDPSRPGPYYNLAILERWYRLDAAAATKRFQDYWKLSHADPDSLYAELGRGIAAPVAGEDPKP